MNSIFDYDFHDGSIISVSYGSHCIELLFEQWNEKQIKIIFEDYYKIKDSHSVGESIYELLIDASSKIIDEVLEDITDNSGAQDEAVGLNSYSFVSSWTDKAVLEIVARSMKVQPAVSRVYYYDHDIEDYSSENMLDMNISLEQWFVLGDLISQSFRSDFRDDEFCLKEPFREKLLSEMEKISPGISEIYPFSL